MYEQYLNSKEPLVLVGNITILDNYKDILNKKRLNNEPIPFGMRSLAYTEYNENTTINNTEIIITFDLLKLPPKYRITNNHSSTHNKNLIKEDNNGNWNVVLTCFNILSEPHLQNDNEIVLNKYSNSEIFNKLQSRVEQGLYGELEHPKMTPNLSIDKCYSRFLSIQYDNIVFKINSFKLIPLKQHVLDLEKHFQLPLRYEFYKNL